jgi:hypothetical protein
LVLITCPIFSDAGTLSHSEGSALQRANVLSLPTLRSLCDFEFHALAFLKTAKSAGLDRREVHKNIFAALPADEAIALGVVKPLDCSLFRHTLLVFLSINFALDKEIGGTQGRTGWIANLLNNRFKSDA